MDQQKNPSTEVIASETTPPLAGSPLSQDPLAVASGLKVQSRTSLEHGARPERAAWKPALWAGFGGAFGAALSFAILETYHRRQWFGLLLAVAWVMMWKRFAEPAIEEKLTILPGAGHHPVVGSKDGAGKWLRQFILSVVLAVSILLVETVAEFIHGHARDDSISFLMELIGPAATMFFITFAWIVGLRRPSPRAAFFGTLAGLVVPSMIFACVGLYLHGVAIPDRYIESWFASVIFWALAGFLGGWTVNSWRASNPMRALVVCLFLLVAVWNVVVAAVYLPRGFASFEVVFTELLNFLRILGWVGGLFFCPYVPTVFQSGKSYAQGLESNSPDAHKLHR